MSFEDQSPFGGSGSHRKLEREFKKLDRQIARDGISSTNAAGPPRAPKAPRSRNSWRTWAALGVVIAVLFGGLTLRALDAVGLPTALTDAISGTLNSGMPPRGVGEASSPRGVAVQPPFGEGGYVFEAVNADNTPAAYDPCRVLHVVIRTQGASPELLQATNDSVAAAARATGLQIVVDGATDEAPSEKRSTYQPERYGKQWAPVLIAFSDPTESPRLAGDVAGYGGSASIEHGAKRTLTYVSGQIVLDTPHLLSMPTSVRTVEARSVIQHELGHVLGLDHIDDATQLMHPNSAMRIDYGDGDLRGLAALGSGPCAPDL